MILQYLNGIDTAGGRAPGSGTAWYAVEQPVGGLLDYDMAGMRAMDAYKADIDELTDGRGLDGYRGINGVEDIELVRSYLVKTKNAVDNVPQLVQAYANPEEFSNMLDYVLRYWDTEQRENAARKMAAREQRLIRAGKIRQDDSETAGGFFTAVYTIVRPQTEMAEAAQDVLSEYKGKLRNAVAQMRSKGSIDKSALAGVGDDDGEMAVTTMLYGWDWYEEASLSGEGESQLVAVAEDGGRDYVERYIRNMHAVVSARPGDFCGSEAEGKQLANALGVIVANLDNGNIDAILARMEQQGQLSGKLRKKLKKLASKVKSAVKTAAKTVAKGVKTAAKATAKATTKAAKTVAKGVTKAVKSVGKAFKKLGKAIAKVTKKVVKFLIRFNPITAGVRGILMLAARFNWFKLAERAYPGTLTQAEAIKQLKITAEYWQKCNTFYKKFANVYTKIGGKESKLKSALAKGKNKKWNGGEVTEAGVTKSAVKKLKESSGGDKAVTTEAEDELKAVEQAAATSKKATLKEDKTLAVGAQKTEQQTVTQTVNEYTTKQATSFYLETATDKVAATIPKGTKLIVDADSKGAAISYSQTGETTGTGLNYYRVSYNGKAGIVLKSNLTQTGLSGFAGTLRNTPALAYRRAGVAYGGDGHALGFAWDIVAIIASATSALLGLVSAMLKAFGKDKAANALAVASAATGVVAVGAGVASQVQQSKAAASSTNKTDSKSTTTSKSGGTSSASTTSTSMTKSGAASAADKINNVVSYVNTGVETVSNAVSTVKALKNSGAAEAVQETAAQSLTQESPAVAANVVIPSSVVPGATTSTATTTSSTSKAVKIAAIGAGILAVFALIKSVAGGSKAANN